MRLFGKKNKEEERVQTSPKEKAAGEEIAVPVSPKPENAGPYRFIVSPHQSEKSSLLGRLNKYVFKVSPNSNKIEIKRAIEQIYRVKVEKVAILSMPFKTRRVGRHEGRKPGFKKAVITLAEGNKIEIGG